MNLQMNSKNYVLKGYMKDDIEKNLSKLEKYFSDNTNVNVTVSGRKNGYKVDITVGAKNNLLKSETEDRDLSAAIDAAIAKMERQLEKNKDKLKRHNNDSIRYENIKASDTADGEVHHIVKNKAFELIPMTSDEACFQLELLDHNFYVFKNIETNSICVVYKRIDGDYGLIEAKK